MNINKYDDEGLTQLMHAAIEGDYEETIKLLELGADPHITDNEFGTATAINFAGREADESIIHKKIYELLISQEPEEPDISDWLNNNTYGTSCYSRHTHTGMSFSFTGVLYMLGFVSLILAPFTGVTLITAAAFFVIAWVIDHA